MNLRLLLSFLFLTFFGALNSNAQTTLAAGDVALIGFSTDDPDQFVFLLLVDVESGTEINFTDRGWDSTAGAFRAGEGTLTWTATSNLPAGTYIDILDLDNPFTADIGTVTDSSSFQLSASGDQILVYQGTDASPTFLNAIHMDGDDGGWSNATGTSSTALPPGLTDGVNAVYFGEIDNGSYTCPSSPVDGSSSSILATIMDTNNWELENGPFVVNPILGGNCTFSVTEPCTVVTGNNTIYGLTFNDFNRNSVFDAGESVVPGVTINLYSDLNGNGIIDGADSIIQTTSSNGTGQYSFSVTPTISTNQVFSKRIDQGRDDAQQEGNNSVVLDGSELKFKIGDPYIGTRFRGVNIPQGSVINSATIDFLAKDNQTGFLSYEISIEDVDDASRFQSVNNNISNRWDSSNVVTWYNMPNWDELVVYTTPDISPLVQSVVNRPGWVANNSLALIFGHFDGPDAERKTESYEKIGNQAALLEINYDAIDPASFIVQIDETTIPTGTSLTSSNQYAISFTSVDEVSCDNDFGMTSTCNDTAGVDTDGDGVNDNCDLDDDNDGILDVDECSDLGKIPVLNSDFEYVDIVSSGLDGGPTDVVPSTGVWKGDASHVPNWESADTVNNHLEIWQNGHSVVGDTGGIAYTGTQWAEINATTNDGLYQDIATTPGDVLNWSFAHRKRTQYAGTGNEDVMRLFIGDPSSPTSQGDFTTSGDASWTVHSGTYIVPFGQTTTRLTFTAISTASGGLTSGNFIDNVQLYVVPNCENSDGDAFEDYQDIDSDDDGIPDNVEAQTTVGYLAPNGVVNTITGLYSNYTGGLSAVDTDLDGINDFLDPDSDNDGTPDIEENGMANIAGLTDADSDGLKDVFETNGALDLAWDVNEDISDPTDLTILPDADNDRLTGGDLDYRDLFDTNLPAIAALNFDGIDDYVNLETSPINSLDEFTVGFWFKLGFLPTGGAFDYTFILGQKEMFEVAIRNNSGTPYLHTRHYYGTGPSGTSLGIPINNENWFHYTAVVNYNTEVIRVYINGRFTGSLGFSGRPRLTNSNPLRIGSKRDVQPDPGEENFEGWVDEVRIFNSLLSTEQIQQMVYQEIENNAGSIHGTIIDKDITDIGLGTKVPWSDLVSYYPMTDIKNSTLKDMSSYGNDARLFNITTLQPQSAPIPYETVADGPWTTEATWLHGDVWDIEDIPNNKDWSIVHIKNDVSTSDSHTQLGMFIDPGMSLTVNGDNAISNSWYLQLDGTLDLADDSQLVQGINSDLVTSATGEILRRQEGNSDVYWYNYWSSPVGTLGVTTLSDNNGTTNNPNNTPFSIDMLKDADGNAILFTSDFDGSEGVLSNRWLYTFQNGLTYWNWVALTPTSSIAPGIGYSQKGTGFDSNIDPMITEQQYIFQGKPNNGTILIGADDVTDIYEAANGGESVQDTTLVTSLIGNPYPSALDARQFIADNSGIIQGTILLWEQWAGSSHWLSEYEGGYGFINSLATERAYQYPGINLADPSGLAPGIKKPSFYIPVGQGFFVEVVTDLGNIEFNNGQRVFIMEADADGVDPENGSTFFRNAQPDAEAENTEDDFQLIRMEFSTSNGASRRFVLGFGNEATDAFDYGMDGGLITTPPADDMGSLLNDGQYVIQAFSPITEDKEIDLVLHASGSHNYSFKAVEISNIPEGQDLFLRDNLTGQYHDLRSNVAYEFTSEAGSYNDRFQVVFNDGTTLSNEEANIQDALVFVKDNTMFIKGLQEQAKSLRITNMLGQVVRTFNEVSSPSLQNGVQLGELSSGVYLVNLISESNLKLDKKIILE